MGNSKKRVRNVGIGSQGLVMFGTDEQKAKWLPRIASGEIVTSFALTEPEAGSDSAAVQTRARRDGDVYVLDGAKRYITNANKAGLFTVMARTDPDEEGRRPASPPSWCRATCPGSRSASPRRRWASRAPTSATSSSRACACRRRTASAQEGEGFKVAMQVLDRGRLHIARGLRRRRRAADRRLRRLRRRAQAVRPGRWPASS